MLTLLDRYIGIALLKASGITLFVVLLLRAFFMYMDELRDVGKGVYSAWDALLYVGLSMPNLVYEFFPMSVLLGALIGLGSLAANSELVVMRAAGVSTSRIVVSVMKTALLLMAVALFIGEVLSSQAKLAGQTIKNVAVSGGELLENSEEGIWSKDDQFIIHMGRVFASGVVTDITLFELDENLRLIRVIAAESGEYNYQSQNWLLSQYKETRLSPEKTTVVGHEQFQWPTELIAPEKLGRISVGPSDLNILELYSQMDYLERNGLNSRTYQLSFWRKVFMPLSVGVMMFLALSFIFGPLRSVTMGARVISGVMVGFAFHVINQVFGSLAQGLTPMLGALLPILLFSMIAMWLIRRT
ncbi:MAG: LPS export ABC transporter permease LptG [Pseudomonadota bacterium]